MPLQPPTAPVEPVEDASLRKEAVSSGRRLCLAQVVHFDLLEPAFADADEGMIVSFITSSAQATRLLATRIAGRLCRRFSG